MKRRSAASKRDLTGLFCVAGMGLLILLAWAALPALPLLPATISAEAPATVGALARDLLVPASVLP